MTGVSPVALATLAAVVFGAADFTAGRAATRLGAATTAAIVQMMGTILVVVWLLASSQPMLPPSRDLVLGMAAGVADGIALMLLYWVLAHGKNSVVAPLTGVLSVAVPTVYELTFLRMPTALQIVGVGLAVLAGLVLGAGGHSAAKGDRSAGLIIGLSLICGVSFGAGNLLLGLLDGGSALAGLMWMRLTAATIAVMLALLVGGGRERPGASHALALGAGMLDGIGFACYVLAATGGLISVAVAILSLYAGMTVLLGAVLLRERIGPIQWLGLATGATSIMLMSR